MSKPAFALSILASAVLCACATRPMTQPKIEPLTEVRHSTGTRGAVSSYERASHYEKRGEIDRALQAYGAALTEDYDNSQARSAMANIYVQRGQLADAQAILTEAIEQQPGEAYLRNNLGYVHYLAGNHRSAVEEFKLALKLDPRHDWARNNLQLVQGALAQAAQKPAAPVASTPVMSAQNTPPFEIWGEPVQAAPAPQLPERQPALVIALGEEPEISPVALRGAGESLGGVSMSDGPALVPVADANARGTAPVTAALPQSLDTAKRTQPSDELVTFTAKPYRLHVVNANGMKGIARKASDFLRGKGVTAQQVGDERPYRASTAIEYREGYLIEAARLRASLPNQPVIVQVAGLPAGADLKLVLGRDLSGKSGLFQAPASKRSPASMQAARPLESASAGS